jgi:hypothetical protein
MDWLGVWTEWTARECGLNGLAKSVDRMDCLRMWTEWTGWECGLNGLASRCEQNGPTRTVDFLRWLDMWIGLDRTVD